MPGELLPHGPVRDEALGEGDEIARVDEHRHPRVLVRGRVRGRVRVRARARALGLGLGLRLGLGARANLGHDLELARDEIAQLTW